MHMLIVWTNTKKDNQEENQQPNKRDGGQNGRDHKWKGVKPEARRRRTPIFQSSKITRTARTFSGALSHGGKVAECE